MTAEMVAQMVAEMEERLLEAECENGTYNGLGCSEVLTDVSQWCDTCLAVRLLQHLRDRI